MTLAVAKSFANIGIKTIEVIVEVHLARGLPSFSIVGLPETAVKESRERVRSAILYSNLKFPSMRITVNLAPADLPKAGGRFDLPIAIGILAASNQIPLSSLEDCYFLGELSLGGDVRSTKGCFLAALSLCNKESKLIVPYDNLEEISVLDSVKAYGVKSLFHLFKSSADFKSLEKPPPRKDYLPKKTIDFEEVIGMSFVKKGLEVAAAGGHHVLLLGPPGAGKTLLASRFSSILPDMTQEEALESIAIYSCAEQPLEDLLQLVRPFRAPHHSASGVSLIGGGRYPRPGEISLAHRGVLFLDEIAEFGRHVLDLLREPLESGFVNISRASYQVNFPARFQLISTANPCPCGFLGDVVRPCVCTQDQIQRYRAKLSGPLRDRVDIQIFVQSIPHHEIFDTQSSAKQPEEKSDVVRKRVHEAQQKQLSRQGVLNFELSGKSLQKYCSLSQESQSFFHQAAEKYGLTARGLHRVLKISRTVADLSQDNDIKVSHLAQAFKFRCHENHSI